MNNILLTCILLTNAMIVAAMIVAFVIIRRKIRYVTENVISFVTPAEEGKPSPLAELTATMGDVLARSMMGQLKATFMGIESGAARSAKAEAAGQAFEAIGSNNPMLAGLLAGSPVLKKFIKNNPGIVQAALSKFMPGNREPVASGNGHSTQSVFKI